MKSELPSFFVPDGVVVRQSQHPLPAVLSPRTSLSRVHPPGPCAALSPKPNRPHLLHPPPPGVLVISTTIRLSGDLGFTLASSWLGICKSPGPSLVPAYCGTRVSPRARSTEPMLPSLLLPVNTQALTRVLLCLLFP